MAWWIPAVIYGILIFWFSHQSHPPGSDLGPDYVLHFLAYGFLGLLAGVGMTKGLRLRFSPWKMLLAWGFVLVYALLDEFHQSFVPGRTASLVDFCADGLGGLVAVILVAILLITTSSRRWT